MHLIPHMCKETLHNLISMYYDYINNDVMLKTIAFRAVEEAVNSNHVNDIVDLSNSDVFSDKFRKYLLKGLCFSTNLTDPICMDLMLGKKVNFEEFEFNRLKEVVSLFDDFHSKYKINLVEKVIFSLNDYILNISLQKKDFDSIILYIENNRESHILRSKYLLEIKNVISEKEYVRLNFLINDDMYCEVKKIPKPSIKKEKKPKSKITHL
jgi:hypothetical protein